MDSHWGTPNHRKRKRRRGPDKPPLPAQIFFDRRLKGDVALLSEDIFSELFPTHAFTTSTEDSARPHYIAVTPTVPSSLFHPHAAPWTILAVKKASDQQQSKQSTNSIITVPATSSSVQALVNALQKASPHQHLSGLHNGIDVHVLDVAPVVLDSVVVSIDSAALLRLEAAQKNFQQSGNARRGNRPLSISLVDPHSSSKTNGMTSNDDEGKTQWDEAIRATLKSPSLIHGGDLLPFPIASHPITHAPPPPINIELCEPVSQGLVTQNTKIVVLDSSKTKRANSSIKSPVIPNGVAEEDEDTSNEQFFSAAESPQKAPRRSEVDTDEDEASNDDDTDMSDAEGDAIGLSLPMLPQQSSGVLSAFSSATPRPGQMYMNGIASPGSVISTFSSSTIRGGLSKGRLFESQGLYARIENDVISPKPAPEEDEEARIFLDTSSLVKVGCFSGDWVRLEAAPDTNLGALASWGLGALDPEKADEEWRVAKVYALPGQQPARPRYAIDRTGHRRSSMSLSSRFDKPSPKVYMSPILLSNLGDPPNVRIATLIPPQVPRNSMRGPLPRVRPSTAPIPPIAREVTFMKLLTPLATERSLDAGLFLGIRRFFESKQRLVKAGDIIGVPIDGGLGKAVYQAAPDEDADQEELLSRGPQTGDGDKVLGTNQVVWFKIGFVAIDPMQDDVDRDDEISWGGIALVKPGNTRMAQSGSDRGKLPDHMHSSWPYYLGAKRLPATAESVTTHYLPSPPKVRITQLRRRLRELMSAATSPQAIHLGLPPVAILLVSTQRHIGKSTVVSNACLDLGYHTFTIDANEIITEGGGGGGDVKTAGLLEARAERGLTCGSEYTTLLIRHIESLTAERMIAALRQILSSSRVFVATTTDVESVPDAVRSLFTHEIEVNAPDEGERESLLQDIVSTIDIPLAADVDLSSVAVKTAALVAGDLVDVVDRALVARTERLEKLAAASTSHKEDPSFMDSGVTLRDILLAGGTSVRCITSADFANAVDHARKNFADAIGAPKIPNVSWDDVGGLTNVKDAVMETIQLPLERPELFAKGMKKRSGILFYGPPGTGKTLLAKAIATEFSLNFFSVKGPELLNMYIGESEANVRRVFQRARDARPCVVFFDELDSVAPKRGNQGDSGGVMDRIVSQLLAELDGMSSGEDAGGGVFVIGATNRPDLLDQALLRPGRFDKMLYLGVSDTHNKQLTILEALTRKFALSPTLNLLDIASKLPFTYTGADLYALCSDAMLKAITRRATCVDSRVKALNASRASTSPPLGPISVAHFFDHYATDEDTQVVVEADDFLEAERELVPSVSVMELEHYERVRAAFEQGEEKNGDRSGTAHGGVGVNGKGKGKGAATDDEEFVLQTKGLSIRDVQDTNGMGVAAGVGKGKGKGKGKAREVDGNNYGFGKATEDDEDLYIP